MAYHSRRWGRVYAAWLQNKSVGADEFAVLSLLATYADTEGRCFPLQETLAEQLKRSRPWVNRVVAALVKSGLLEKTRRRRGGSETSCEYRVVFNSTDSLSELTGDGTTAAAGPLEPTRSPEWDSPVEVQSHDTTSRTSRTPASVSMETPQSHRRDTNQDHPIQDSENSHTAGARGVAGCLSDGPSLVGEDWVPTPADIAWAAQHCRNLDVLAHVQHFVSACHAKGYIYRDHSAAWRSWAVKAQDEGRFIQSDARGGRCAGEILERSRSSGCLGNSRNRRPNAPPQTPGKPAGSTMSPIVEANALKTERALQRLIARRGSE
jgi:Helix-turn-helix domain